MRTAHGESSNRHTAKPYADNYYHLALIRLRPKPMDELKKHVSTSALHDTSTRQGDQTTECHPKTRRRLLGELADVLGSTQNRVNWLYGPAGAGKTAIMRSLASLFERRGQFIGGFHFWRSDSGRNTLKHFVATLAYQLAQTEPSTLPLITRALAQDNLLLDKSTKMQMEKLIIEPLLACKADKSPGESRCIVIDGLDECDEDGQREFLEILLPSLVLHLSSRGITFFIASRPERAIDNLFTHPRLSNSTNRIFLEPSFEDVREFVVAEFEEINRCHPRLKKKHGGQWPKNAQLEHLIEKSSGYFILCATAMRHINPPILHGRPPDQRLDEVLEAVSADPLRPLDALYLFILRQHAPKLPGLFDQWKRSIGLACMPLIFPDGESPWLLFDANTALVTELWYGMDTSALEEHLSGLESLLYFNDRGRPKVHHASFPDFIFNRSRSQELHTDPAHLHRDLACLIVKTLSFFPLTYDRELWTRGFRYHSEYASVADDMLAIAIDDINWPQYSERLDISKIGQYGVFTKLDFLASIFLELQRFYDFSDVRSAFQRRQSMVAGFTPVAKKALAALAGSEALYKLEGVADAVTAGTMAGIWQYFLVPGIGPPSIKNPSLLHTHSTLCLQHQRFPTTPLERWAFTCIRSGCLTHDSDDYQALAESLKKNAVPSSLPSAYHIWYLLTTLDLLVQPILSRFFDERFSERCAAMMAQEFERPVWWVGKEIYSGADPFFGFHEVNRITEHLDHSAPTQLLLDKLWYILILHDGGEFLDRLKYYADNGRTRTEAENPFCSRATRLILAYFNRCLHSDICPNIVTEIHRYIWDGNWRKLTSAPLSEAQQRERWSKYSTLVAYVPPTLPEDCQYTSEATPQLSIDGGLVSDGQSDSIQKPDEDGGASPLSQPIPQDVSGLVGTGPSTETKKRKSLWKRLLRL